MFLSVDSVISIRPIKSICLLFYSALQSIMAEDNELKLSDLPKEDQKTINRYAAAYSVNAVVVLAAVIACVQHPTSSQSITRVANIIAKNPDAFRYFIGQFRGLGRD